MCPKCFLKMPENKITTIFLPNFLKFFDSSWLSELVTFWFRNILAIGIPNPDTEKFLNFFLLYRICLQYLRFTNLTVVFLKLPLDFPMRWQPSKLLWEIWILTALNTSITECSRLLSLILSGIPVISTLFLQLYCSTEIVALSRIMNLL